MKKCYQMISKILNEAQFMDIKAVSGPCEKFTDRELSRAIRMGIAAEHEATHLYEVIADNTNNPDVKKLMQDIANEEKVHVGELESLLATIDSNDKEKREEGNKEFEEKVG